MTEFLMRRVKVLHRSFAGMALLLGLLLFSGTASAVTVAGLYQASVAVEDTGMEARQEGFERALEVVLVRVTGTRDILEHDELDALVDELEGLVEEFGYTREDDRLLLDVTFGSATLSRRLAEMDVSIWGANRPQILAWVVVDERAGRELVRALPLDDDEDAQALGNPWQDAVTKAAQNRGLPLMLPTYDEDEQGRLSLSEIWGQFMEPIREASEPYGADRLAVVRVSARGNQLQARWQLDVRRGADERRGTVSAESPEALMTELMDAWAQLYADIYAVDPSRIGDAEHLNIKVSEVRSLSHYAAVRRALMQMEPVSSVEPAAVSRDELELRIGFSGDVGTLEEYIALDQRFQDRSEPSPDSERERPRDEWLQGNGPVPTDEDVEEFSRLYPTLYYRWVADDDEEELDATDDIQPLEVAPDDAVEPIDLDADVPEF